jgi:hypothetical protein
MSVTKQSMIKPIATAAVAWIMLSSAAQASCPGFAQVTVALSPQPLIAAYDPFSGAAATQSMTVTVTNASNQQCDAALHFFRPAGGTVAMTNGASTLNYSLETTGGVSLVNATGLINGVSPPAGNRLDLLDIPANSTRLATVVFRIPTNQIVSAGPYTDTGVTMQLVRLTNRNSPNLLIRSVSVTPTATVVAKCVLSAASPSNLNFNAAISNGRPNPGFTAATSLTTVRCTAPTKLRLSGAALRTTPVATPQAGFDNLINWSAAGSFGAANATLTTTGAVAIQATSTATNVSSGATTNGTINITVNLLATNPLLAGAYSGILTIAIDPNF